MDPASLIPPPLAVPVAPGWLKLLLLATFYLHLLAMNAMVGGLIIAFFLHLRGRAENSLIALQRDVARKLPILAAVTINFGVAPFLFIQALYGRFLYVSSIVMGAYWLAMVALVMGAYAFSYVYKGGFDSFKLPRGVMAGTVLVLFLLVAVLFTANMTLMLKPALWTAYFTHPGGTFLPIKDPVFLPRILHTLVGAVAVGGLFVAWVWEKKKNRGTPGAGANADLGMAWFTRATMAQLLVGAWYFMALDPPVRSLFMGKSIFATLALQAGLLGAALALWAGWKRKIKTAAGMSLAVMFVMVVIRDQVRGGYLAAFQRLRDLPVAPETSSFFFFLICFCVSAGLVALALKWVRDAEPRRGRSSSASDQNVAAGHS